MKCVNASLTPNLINQHFMRCNHHHSEHFLQQFSNLLNHFDYIYSGPSEIHIAIDYRHMHLNLIASSIWWICIDINKCFYEFKCISFTIETNLFNQLILYGSWCLCAAHSFIDPALPLGMLICHLRLKQIICTRYCAIHSRLCAMLRAALFVVKLVYSVESVSIWF